MGAELPRLPLDRRDLLLHVGELFVRAGRLLRDGLLGLGEIPVPSRIGGRGQIGGRGRIPARGRAGLPRPGVGQNLGDGAGQGRGRRAGPAGAGPGAAGAAGWPALSPPNAPLSVFSAVVTSLGITQNVLPSDWAS